MGYKKAMGVLPNYLLAAIQNYVDGEYIYIPRKAGNKRHWGERNNTRHQLDRRNRDIVEQHQCGMPVQALSRQFNLSPKTIYKILSVAQNNN